MELKFEPRTYVAELGADNRYFVDYCSSYGWAVSFRAVGGCWTDIDPRDADGNAGYWPTFDMAMAAAQQHYKRMLETGETPDVSASRIPTDPAWYEAKMGGTT